MINEVILNFKNMNVDIVDKYIDRLKLITTRRIVCLYDSET